MTWWKQLPQATIRQIDWLSGRPALLAVWPRREQVDFFEAKDGKPRDTRTITPPAPSVNRREESWQSFTAVLKTPHDTPLPLVAAGSTTIHQSDDGQMRLYQIDDQALYLESEGREVKLDVAAEGLAAVVLDRALGTISALDSSGKLHLYQQNIAVGAFDLGLSSGSDAVLNLAISQGGSAIFASDGMQLLHINPGGQVIKRVDLHYLAGLLTCSPNGALLATADRDSGVIRLYNGSELTPLHQRFAVDLLQKAQMVQDKGLTDTPAAALTALAVSSAGGVAFALDDVLCVSDVTHMDTLPRPRRLL